MDCKKCDPEHGIVSHEDRIALGDITYSRTGVELGPTGIELAIEIFGHRAFGCKYLPVALQVQIKEFVLQVELAHDSKGENDGQAETGDVSQMENEP